VKFVAALLTVRGPAVKAQVDPRTRSAEDLGPSRSAALLIRAHRDGRAQRAADDALMAELGRALRPVRGEHLARDAGREAWRARQQRGEES
jgi:hypothetical protein